MTDERKEHIIFMAGETEGASQPERREGERNTGERRGRSVPHHGGGQPPERSTPPAPLNREPEVALPTAPDLERSSEEEAIEERQEKLFEHITEGRAEEAMGMMLEDRGLNPEDELNKPEVQRVLQGLKTFTEEMNKPEAERDASKLEAAAATFREAPKHMQDLLRPMLGIHMSEDQVRRMLPETPVAPTGEEEGEGGHDITAPTGEADQRTEEEREIEAAVKPFVQNIEDKIRDEDWEGAKDEAQRLRDMLKKVPWGKVVGRSAQAILYSAMATYVAYIFLMAKASALSGKK